MVLTDRDIEVLQDIYQFKMLTREQIERLRFPSEGKEDHGKTGPARRRLKLLFHNGELERIPYPVHPGLWAWRPVYRLSKKGAELVAKEKGIPPADLPYWGQGDDRDGRKTRVGTLFLEHRLHINDVRIALTLSAKDKGYIIEKWIDDGELKGSQMRNYVTVPSAGHQSQRVPIIPDAYFVVNFGDKRAHFFLELDRATMTTKRFKDKIVGYKKYIETGKYEKNYHTRSLRVLTITTSLERLQNLKRVTEECGGRECFWFAVFDEAVQKSPLTDPLWYVSGDTLRHAITESQTHTQDSQVARKGL